MTDGDPYYQALLAIGAVAGKGWANRDSEVLGDIATIVENALGLTSEEMEQIAGHCCRTHEGYALLITKRPGEPGYVASRTALPDDQPQQQADRSIDA